ncbi:tRNA methyltransferase complex GCD14 subunit [Oleidesulfovibrio alaskensis G20]|jgi:tRNA (adenine57-N1/adenine58-N1)-methyltransferase|uniref:tRNA (adenine(58)-N(1))-methyltransferase TrmI n=1 Tax=Oleidesulfovibrio alaskensis (strain ATCC BAA-1058 / DSM 17464 / G20) TaxID=207559 RepID=Q315Q6_OLEA2|nr:tRNA (adenine-N1)-methyltransferase [Oleidesulfovibrio alaskensis]ABB37340.1 tRNA methyltransferase complex GCD14 subunit [Oleidesulfovibrio alaskensis G20]MBG0773243.1 tRNA (adenine-N1)-methyltransferase [Oleidesulfovibrio alaskensis]MBL3583114.1 tRNA (adenine-N1)-methyltransferase [Oleidesulfovibrio alaskensis]
MPRIGELVLLVSPKGKRYLRRVEPGADLHCGDGIVAMEDVMGADFGTIVRSHSGKPFRLYRPALPDLLRGIKRQTQVIYPKDIGYICMRLGVGPGRKIIESGSGSGGLTLAMSFFAGETGEIHTHEAREEFMKLCRKNLDWAGLGSNVTLYHQDIKDGFLTGDADALFLDVRDPWEYLHHIPAAVKSGAMLGFLVPTVDQVSRLLFGLEKGPYDEVEVCEVLVRGWKPVPDRLRPMDRMVAHTGFLIFARHQEQIDALDAYKYMGTRERKQESARRERLGLPPLRGETGGEAGDDFIDEPDGSCED